MFNLFSIPGYADAVEHERLVRDSAFLINPLTGSPIMERIGEFEVFQMTLNQYTALQIENNPLLYEGEPTEEQIAQFLWCISVDYEPSKEKQGRWFLERCEFLIEPPTPYYFVTPKAVSRMKKLQSERQAKTLFIKTRCQEYMRDTLQDEPPHCKTAGYSKSYFSKACKWSAIMAREYHAGIGSVMNMPLKQLFQFLNEIKEYHKLDVPLCNPSDDVIAHWQAQQSERRN